MASPTPSLMRRYALAAALVVAAVGLRLLLDPLLGDKYPFATVVLAVLVAAGYGGFGPGLFGAVIGAVVTAWLVFEPRGSFAVNSPADRLLVAVYLGVATGGSALGGYFRRTREAARTALVAVTTEREELRRALAALKASEARFTAVIQNAPAVVFVKDADGVYLMANPQFTAFAGRPIEEILGKTDAELFAPPIADRFRNEDLQVLADGGVHTFEEAFSAGGVNSTFLTAKFPLPDASGKPMAVCGIATDITDRKRREIASRFLAGASAALGALTDVDSALQTVAALAVPNFADWCAVDMAEPGGALRRVAVAHVDPAKVKLAHEIHRRRPPDPNAPTGVPQIVRSGNSELVADITDQMLAAAIQDAELLALMRELGLRSYIGVPLTVRGKTLGAVTFIAAESGRRYDATDLAAAEDLARRAAVAVENAQLYHAVREADRRKDEFLATLAHELRNPLAPIRTSLYLLGSDTADARTRDRAREMIGRQVHTLIRLVDDLLDVSRVMRGKVDLRTEPVDLGAIAVRAVETAQELIDARGHTLTVSVPPDPVQVVADPVRLAQVIGNLLTNAAKYTDPGGRITLAVEAVGGEVVVRVRDTGIGIARDMLPKVFDLFVQVATSTDRSEGGLGIGLTLVRRLIEMHGGAVEAHSDGPGRGSEFVLRLPIPQPTIPAPGLNGSAPAHVELPAARRILVVDDHPDAADSLAMLLRLDGHDVRVARNGPDALAEVRADRPEVVLLDLGMPGMDGFEVARQLRHDGLRDVLLVALSGWGQEADRQRTREAGFDHHLVKPADPADLRAVLALART